MLCGPLQSIWPTHSWIKLNLLHESLECGLSTQALSTRQTCRVSHRQTRSRAALLCQQLTRLREWAHDLRASGQMPARMQLVCTEWRFSWRGSCMLRYEDTVGPAVTVTETRVLNGPRYRQCCGAAVLWSRLC